MRPIKLRFKGLRSYRAEQEIDFTDVSLMAIVGHTGAGKSSIPEAICYALYGNPTWDGKGSRQLVAHGSDGSMSVELTFQARGKTWRITRTTSATGYPPSTHRLEGLDDRSQIDDARPVNARIRELVGLKYGAFLKAVVLPQGRFQELLETTPRERTTALKSILGLDRITDVRAQAQHQHDQLQPLLTELQLQRAKLLDDPQAAIEDANRRLTAAAARRAELDQVSSSIKQAKLECAAASERAKQCCTAAEELSRLMSGDIEDSYRQLVDADNSLAAQLSGVERQLDELSGRQAVLKDVLATADTDGTGVSGTATAIATLPALLNQLSDIQQTEQDLHAEQSSIDAQAADLQARKAAQRDLSRTADDAATRAKQAQQAYEDAAARMSQARSLLLDARSAISAAEQAGQTARDAQDVLEQHAGAAVAARDAAEQAERELDAAATALEAARRSNAAVHAASASHPGDPCPICVRPLPDEFTPPTAASTTKAEAAHTTAKKRAKNLAAEHASAVGRKTAAEADLRKAIAREGQLRSLCDEAINALNVMFDQINLAAADDELLADRQAEVDSTLDQMTLAQTQANAARDECTAHSGEIRQIEQTFTARRQALTKAQKTLAQRKDTMAQAHVSLPSAYQVDGPLSAAGIEQKLTAARQRDGELSSITSQLDQIHQQSQRLGREHTNIAQRRRRTVDQPATQLGRRAQTLADRAGQTAVLINVAAPPDRPDSLALATDAGWAGEVLTTVTKIIEACRNKALLHRDAAAKASAHIADILRSADITNENALTELLDQTKTDARIATRDLQRAHDELPRCRDLDRRITGAKPLVDSLLELVKVLADGKFMAVVVRRRQRALLGLASEILMSMTDQFAFSDDFRMIDRHTGQPRDVQTLSGGEKFQASLALALALVELTSRGGGRVEALFLDEGFGSLDTNALGEALEALTQQAAAGRLVAVISHMRAIAEYFDNILVVSKGIGGSQARWATSARRDHLLADELAEGLVE